MKPNVQALSLRMKICQNSQTCCFRTRSRHSSKRGSSKQVSFLEFHVFEFPEQLTQPTLTGYRYDWCFFDCARSVFMKHNELCNIWTHLIPLLCALCGVTFHLSPYSTMPKEPLSAYLVNIAYGCSTVFCFLFSTLFHVFGCHSRCDFLKLNASLSTGE